MTLAAWLIMVGSVIVVAMVFDRVGTLQTLETRESVEKFLAEPPGADLGVGVDGVLTLLRVVSMVTAGCATAAVILGYQVLRRSRSARLALTVIAVPLFFTGMVTGGFVSSVVAAAALMLWLQPSRDWFRGPTAAAPGVGALAPRMSAPADASAAPVPAAARAPQVAERVPQAPPARPPAVAVACVLAWVGSGLTALALAASAVVLALDPDVLLDEAHRQNPDLADQGVTDGVLTAMAFAMVAGVILWCVAAAVLAILVFRGVGWARVVLLVSAGIAAAASLVGAAIGGVLLLAPFAAAVAGFALLLRPSATAWFSQPR